MADLNLPFFLLLPLEDMEPNQELFLDYLPFTFGIK
jgi:hypothetical protein